MSTLEATTQIKIPLTELELSFSRSSGPGGQNVNKVNSKVTLSWHIEQTTCLRLDVKKRVIEQNRSRISNDNVLVIHSEKFRDQKRNIQDCYDKVIDIVKKASYKPKKRVATKPSKSSIEKRIKIKKSRSDTKKNRSKIAY